MATAANGLPQMPSLTVDTSAVPISKSYPVTPKRSDLNVNLGVDCTPKSALPTPRSTKAAKHIQRAFRRRLEMKEDVQETRRKRRREMMNALRRQKSDQGPRSPVVEVIQMPRLSSTLPGVVSERPIRSVYSLGRVLGEGRFGVVFLAKHLETGEMAAVKQVRKMNFRYVQALKREYTCLKRCAAHPNIVTVRDVFEDARDMYLVMDFVKGGDLFQRIERHGHYTELHACKAFRQVLAAVNFMHSQRIVHLDLKPENILCSTDVSAEFPECPQAHVVHKDAKDFAGDLVITDLGLAEFLETGKMLQKLRGTVKFSAPEVLRGDRYSFPADLWSAGCILYTLLCGHTPWDHQNVDTLRKRVLAGEIPFPREVWDHISIDAQDLVRKLLRVNPARRPTARKALQHPWFYRAPKQQKEKPHQKLSEMMSNLKEFNRARDSFRSMSLISLAALPQTLPRHQRRQVKRRWSLIKRHSGVRLAFESESDYLASETDEEEVKKWDSP